MTSRAGRLLAAALALVVLAAACTPSGQPHQQLSAVLPSATNLFVGSEVRVLGLRVGEVEAIEPLGDRVRVQMAVDPERPIPADAQAHLLPIALLGERVIQLDPPYTGGPRLADGAEIPLARTSVPAETDEVLRSFENFLRGLDRDSLAGFVDALAGTLDGQGVGLNDLVGGGADALRVLADASGDLNALVAELAALNETLASRADTIGPVLERLSTVLQTLSEERGEIIGSVANLQRLTAELRPLLDKHEDPLVRDLEVLATTLATVDRNRERLGEMLLGGNQLFTAAGRAFDYENAGIRLDDEAGELPAIIERRLAQRLAGVCIRLGVLECSDPDFFLPHLPVLLCLEGVSCTDARQTGFAEALAAALGVLPPSVRDQLAAEALARAQAQQDPAPPAPPDQPAPAPPRADAPPPEQDPRRSLVPALPLPDPRLAPAGARADDDRSLLDRLLGGRR